MPRRILDRIREAIRNAEYDMTAHAVEELAEDQLYAEHTKIWIFGCHG
jgi:hypothetical protein